MKIACLQFAPQVGDVDNNLNRADAVLNKANAPDLEGLDLLVLPELAFTGYNFKSLQQISPFLEHAGSGITSLWARTTALKHDCTVVVGYPEKVDVSPKWPTSPEYYNSALVVNGEGDTIANYRKSFLYFTDETWALEGGEGFFQDTIPGLGNVALGICTDLNPYKLEAPWDAFEFGCHVLESHANVVILTMAWQTHQDPSAFSRRPKEPDLETLVYWVQRLEPLIRAEKDEEVIVVFCNRTGAEDEAMYTGTSAVIGVKGGEVFVYGVLGRGVKELLVVDTNSPPKSKLTDADAVEAENALVEETASDVEGGLQVAPDDAQAAGIVYEEIAPIKTAACRPLDTKLEAGPTSPRSATTARLPWLASPDPTGDTPADSRSPTRLQIPTSPPLGQYMPMDSAITDDIIIDSPEESYSPVSVRRPSRTGSAFPQSPWRFPSKSSPYVWHPHDGSHSVVFGGGATMTPITPIDNGVRDPTPIDPKPPQWFWKHEPTLSALTESVREEEESSEPEGKQQEAMHSDDPKAASQTDKEQTEQKIDAPEERPPLNSDWADLAGVLEELRVRPGSVLDRSSSRAGRPSSPKSRNLSRNTSRSRLFDTSTHGDEWEPASHDDFSHLLARPASRAGQRLVTRRSNSLEDITNYTNRTQVNRTRNYERTLARRPPSRLRHAIFIPDEPEEEDEEEEVVEDDELDYGFESPDDGGEYSPRQPSRGRQAHAALSDSIGEDEGAQRWADYGGRHIDATFNFAWLSKNETQEKNRSPPAAAEQGRADRDLSPRSPFAVEEAVPALSSATSSVLTFDDEEGDDDAALVTLPRFGGGRFADADVDPAVAFRDHRAVSASALKGRVGGLAVV